MNDNNGSDITLDQLIPATMWEDHKKWPPIGGLRHLLFNRAANGFDYCVVKVGGRILIHEGRFDEWVNINMKH
jgi:hypothetical protein